MLLLYRVQFACLYFLTCYTCCALCWCCCVLSLVWLLLYCTGVASYSLSLLFFLVCSRGGGWNHMFAVLWSAFVLVGILGYTYIPNNSCGPPLLHCFRILKIVSAGPNSCLFCNMWFADADCGFQFLID